MKAFKTMLTVGLVFVVAVSMALTVNGCKEKTTAPPVVDLTVPDDIFPLVSGRFIEYNGYLTQNDTETKIAASEATYYTKWSIGTSIPITAVFPSPPFTVPSGNGVLVRDTTRIPGIGLTFRFTPVFVKYDSTTAEYQYLTNLGLFYRTFAIRTTGTTNTRADSLRFIFLAKPRAKIGNEFTAFDENFSGTVSGSPATITLKITGKFEAKEDLVIGTTTYNTYRVVISRIISLGATPIATGVTAKLWVVKGVGPVKMWLYGDAENSGHFRTMTNKNF